MEDILLYYILVCFFKQPLTVTSKMKESDRSRTSSVIQRKSKHYTDLNVLRRVSCQNNKLLLGKTK